MKPFRIVLIALMVVAAAAASVVMWHASKGTPPSLAAVTEHPVPVPVESAPVVAVTSSQTNQGAEVEPTPVQPIEERGDAMMFEIDALQNTPFDQSVTMPFD